MPIQSSPPSVQAGRAESPDRPGLTRQEELRRAQQQLAQAQQDRLTLEITNLTARYGGDVGLATQVANDRALRGFAASDPEFAKTIAPLQQKVATLEEEIRRTRMRRAGTTLGGNGVPETLG